VPDIDAAEFDEFYLRTRDRLAVHIAALTGDTAEAVDHVQEAFVRAWSRWTYVGGLDDPEGWVRRVAHNLAVSRWRRARRLVLGQPPAAGSAVEWTDEQRPVFEALRALSRAHREAIVLHHLVGLSVAEVATELDVPAGTVKSWLSRGRTQLAAALATSPQPEEVTP
jgi:RNA polymerase sigma-70 factor (sigma-E family)